KVLEHPPQAAMEELAGAQRLLAHGIRHALGTLRPYGVGGAPSLGAFQGASFARDHAACHPDLDLHGLSLWAGRGTGSLAEAALASAVPRAFLDPRSGGDI